MLQILADSLMVATRLHPGTSDIRHPVAPAAAPARRGWFGWTLFRH